MWPKFTLMKMFSACSYVYVSESLREESRLPSALFRSSSCFSPGTVEIGSARVTGSLKPVVFSNICTWVEMPFALDIDFCALDPSGGFCREAHMELQQAMNNQSSVQRQTQTRHRKKMEKCLGKDWITDCLFKYPERIPRHRKCYTTLTDFDNITAVFT